MLLRLGVGTALIYPGIGRLAGGTGTPITTAQDLIEAAGGVFLLAGLWTPVMGAITAVVQVWIAVSEPDGRWDHLFLALLIAGLAMVGPGAWSIDARLFGRKKFRIGGRNG